MPVRIWSAAAFASISAALLSAVVLPAALPGAAPVAQTRDAVTESQAGPRPAADIWRPRYEWGRYIQSPSLRARMQRHYTYMHSGVPRMYRGKVSPLAATPETIDRGRRQYKQHCAACHHMDGGDAAFGLSPPPAFLSLLVTRPKAADEYLLWSISDGGRWFDSAMPGFAVKLTRTEIWEIIAFMRAGFPAAATGNGPRR
jgi:mono/diheme cytochrome c family protein